MNPVSRTGATDREVALAPFWAEAVDLSVHSGVSFGELSDLIGRVHDAARAAAAPDSGQRDLVARFLAELDVPGFWDRNRSGAVSEVWCQRHRNNADALLALLAEQPGGGE